MNRLLGAEPTSTHAFQVIHRSFAFGHRHLCTALWEWVEPDITHGDPMLSRQRVDHSEVYSDTVAVTGGTQAECNVEHDIAYGNHMLSQQGIAHTFQRASQGAYEGL